MIKVSVILLLLFSALEINIYNIPLNINDIFGIIFGLITFLYFIINKKYFFNNYSLNFLRKDFEIFILFGNLLILFKLIFSNDILSFSLIKAGRMFYMYISIFTSVFIMDQIFKFLELKKRNLFIFFYIISLASFIYLSISTIYSLTGNCKIVYGGSFCFLNQKSYSGNGFIGISIFYINLSIQQIITSFKINLKYNLPTKAIIYFNLIVSFLIILQSGSRGALLYSVLVILLLNYDSIFKFITAKYTLKGILFIFTIIAIISSGILQKLGIRSISLFLIDPSTPLKDISNRFNLGLFPDQNLIFGLGNFGISKTGLSTSYFDSTIRIFTISFGLIGFTFFIYMIFLYFKKILIINKTLIKIKKYNLIKLTYTTFIYTLITSFSNEVIILNGISIIHTFSYIMPLMLINYLSYKYMLLTDNMQKK